VAATSDHTNSRARAHHGTARKIRQRSSSKQRLLERTLKDPRTQRNRGAGEGTRVSQGRRPPEIRRHAAGASDTRGSPGPQVTSATGRDRIRPTDAPEGGAVQLATSASTGTCRAPTTAILQCLAPRHRRRGRCVRPLRCGVVVLAAVDRHSGFRKGRASTFRSSSDARSAPLCDVGRARSTQPSRNVARAVQPRASHVTASPCAKTAHATRSCPPAPAGSCFVRGDHPTPCGAMCMRCRRAEPWVARNAKSPGPKPRAAP
jgi:hypothetical protein